ncbi:hypothetical protein AQUCO_00800239v1 [Aquilegia coerulea]|uniref:Gnk2-homologous domain-containing protein n=1 Tax=Aquilegia coerulea TaxID=218851 RepID=A0A2G5EHV9_AQUCA|nr:hypothetical protein AQUCO_00800239v1 [Aquilegia coerulea]
MHDASIISCHSSLSIDDPSIFRWKEDRHYVLLIFWSTTGLKLHRKCIFYYIVTASLIEFVVFHLLCCVLTIVSMDSRRQILFLSYILATFFICLSSAQPLPNFQAYYCNFGYTGNYTSNSVFQTNLDTLPSNLTSSDARFYNFSIGQNPDRVNVIALCRGDVDMSECRRCLSDSNTKLRELCRNEKQSIGWYDDCMLRYSDQPIFNTMQTLPNAYTYNPMNVSNGNTAQFNLAVRSMLNRLLEEASTGTVQKFATGNTRIGPDINMTIYALAECTPDLSASQCRECLNGTSEKLPECCNGRIGGRVLRPSCNFRYEVSRFYNVTQSDSPPVVDRGGPSGVPSGVTFPEVRKVSLILLVLAMFFHKV